MSVCAGIDVGKDVHVISVSGKCHTFPATELEKICTYLTRAEVKKVILESTGVYSVPIINMLVRCDFVVYIVPPYHISTYRGGARSAKTDNSDARRLEEYLLDDPVAWPRYRVTEEYIKAKELGMLCSERENYVKEHVRLYNRILTYLYIVEPRYGSLTESALYKKVKDGFITDEIVVSRLENLKRIAENVKFSEEQIQKFVQNTEFLKQQYDIIMSIPLFSAMDAAFILGKVVNIRGFSSVKKFKAFIGFAVIDRQSGTSLRKVTVLNSHKYIKSKMYMLVLRNLKGTGNKHIANMYYYYYFKFQNSKKAFTRTSARIIERLYWCAKSNNLYDPVRPFVQDETIMKLIDYLNQKEKEKKLSRVEIKNLDRLRFFNTDQGKKVSKSIKKGAKRKK